MGDARRNGMNRRRFLVRTGLTLSGPSLNGVDAASTPAIQPDLGDWGVVREQFALTRDRIHLAGLYLASHPAPVREAIERHRHGLDANPIGYEHAHHRELVAATLHAAGDYLGVAPTDVALTDSTTMGLGLLYNGIKIKSDQEILTTTHDFYATVASLQFRAERDGIPLRHVTLYQDPATATKEEIVAAFRTALRPATRVVAVTWVHSGTGVKLPLGDLAAVVAEANADREEQNRALLCVDGVHGLGVEDVALSDLGCDFFIAGCHKWLFGPRGTGLVWGNPNAWPVATPAIPSFDAGIYADLGGDPNAAGAFTPGGFHSFEHRWALAEAFRFHLAIGKRRIAERIHLLNRQLKEGLADLTDVTVQTPLADDLSAGIVCFDIAGMAPERVVARLDQRGIVASVTPYATRHIRLAPGILNTPAEIDETIHQVRAIAAGR